MVLAWITRRFNALAAVLLAALAVVVALAWELNQARRAAEHRAEAADERAQLATAALPVAEPIDVKALEREAEKLRRSNQALASAYSAELAEVHELRAILVARGSTGPVTAHGVPRDRPAGPEGAEARPLPSMAPSRGRLLLAEGDKAEIPVDIEIDRTDKQNLLLNVTASAVRLDPLPVEEIIPVSLVRQQSIHVEPEVIQGPTVYRTRWWAVGAAAFVGFGAGVASCGEGR